MIDDHAPTSEFIGEVLRACEIETYNTSDSKLAEARLRREKFDVVFVDAKMPPPDGLELARRIRASGPNKRATIVMITGEQGSRLHAARLRSRRELRRSSSPSIARLS